MMVDNNLMKNTSKRMEGQIKEIERKQEQKRTEVCPKVYVVRTLLLILTTDSTNPNYPASTAATELSCVISSHTSRSGGIDALRLSTH